MSFDINLFYEQQRHNQSKGDNFSDKSECGSVRTLVANKDDSSSKKATVHTPVAHKDTMSSAEKPSDDTSLYD